MPISLKIENETLKQLVENNLIQTQNARSTLYRQWVAWQMSINHFIDSADSIEPVETIRHSINFLGNIIKNDKIQVSREVRKTHTALTIWTDRSKLINDRSGATFC